MLLNEKLTSLQHWALRLFIFLSALDALETGIVVYAFGSVGEDNPFLNFLMNNIGILPALMVTFIGTQLVIVNVKNFKLGWNALWVLNMFSLYVVLSNAIYVYYVFYIIWLVEGMK